jgi:hypothetical protein
MFKIAIPSHKRSDTINKETLRILKEHKLLDVTTVFVAGSELSDYKNCICRVVDGRMGRMQQINYIFDYYDDDQELIIMDDDIEEFCQKDGRKLVPLESLEDLCVKGFELLEKHGAGLFGVYMMDNPFYMKDKISNGLYFIDGTFCGLINMHDPQLRLTSPYRTGREMSLLRYLYCGNNIRFNNVCYKSREFTHPGGMQTDPDRMKKMEEAAIYLHKKFPDLTELFRHKDNSLQIRFRRMP